MHVILLLSCIILRAFFYLFTFKILFPCLFLSLLWSTLFLFKFIKIRLSIILLLVSEYFFILGSSFKEKIESIDKKLMFCNWCKNGANYQHQHSLYSSYFTHHIKNPISFPSICYVMTWQRKHIHEMPIILFRYYEFCRSRSINIISVI